jgi:crotonobetainyl-CoA:carnitine CoA-transferase CaiB-like acyl-CoA transferase
MAFVSRDGNHPAHMVEPAHCSKVVTGETATVPDRTRVRQQMLKGSAVIVSFGQPPLDGVRIIAVEQYGAGPWATMMLADLGAEIIKVEPPGGGGDIGRAVPPYAIPGDSVFFQAFNRTKKSITLNLQHQRGPEVLHRLVETSDGVFNNLRGDLPAKLGLDYASLAAVKSSIVCCSLSAYGRSGARTAEPGYDYVMQGYAGWMSLTGEPGTPPQKSGLSLVDLSAGVMASLGMVSAILRARLSGEGGDVDVSLFDAAIAQLCYPGAWHLSMGYEPTRTADSSHPSMIPSQVLPTQDGYMVVMCAKEEFYRRLVSIMGAPELATDARFNSFSQRLKHREELVPLLKELSRQRPTAEWLDLLRGQVPCGPVNSVPEALADPQVADDDMILALDHPEFPTLRVPGAPIKFSGEQVQHHRGPKMGEHTDEVLGSYAGYSAEEIRELRSIGAI